MNKINELRDEDTKLNNEWADKKWLQAKNPGANSIEINKFTEAVRMRVLNDIAYPEARELSYTEIFK